MSRFESRTYLVVSVLTISLFSGSLASAKIKKSEKFPGFTLPALQMGGGRGVASTGNDVISVEQFKGKVVLVDFWASWCEPCKKSLPFYEKLRSKYGKRGLQIVGVNVDEDEAKAKEFLAGHKVNFPIGYDRNQKLAGQYEISTMPTAYLIDRKGRVVSIRQGYKEAEQKQLEKAIAKVL